VCVLSCCLTWCVEPSLDDGVCACIEPSLDDVVCVCLNGRSRPCCVCVQPSCIDVVCACIKQSSFFSMMWCVCVSNSQYGVYVCVTPINTVLFVYFCA